MHRSPISITRAQPRSDRNSPPRNPLQRPEPRTPLRTSTLDPQVVENLRSRPGCETPSLQSLTATLLVQVNRNTLKGVSLRCNNVPSGDAGSRSPSARPPDNVVWAPTATRTSQYVRTCAHALGAKFLTALHLPSRPSTHETQRCVYCCASMQQCTIPWKMPRTASKGSATARLAVTAPSPASSGFFTHADPRLRQLASRVRRRRIGQVPAGAPAWVCGQERS